MVPLQLWLGWAKARARDSVWVFHMGHHLLLPRVHIGRNLESQVEWELTPMNSDMGYGYPKQHVYHQANHPFLFLYIF